MAIYEIEVTSFIPPIISDIILIQNFYGYMKVVDSQKSISSGAAGAAAIVFPQYRAMHQLFYKEPNVKPRRV